MGLTSTGIVSKQQSHEKTTKPKLAVLMTGSTGSLGTYLLDILLDLEQTERVVCLSRSENGRERQAESLKSRGLRGLTASGVDFFHADLAKPLLGLEQSVYNELTDSITTILHNGWPVDFNRSFATFEPSIQGVRNLIHFAYECKHRCSIFFVSSISVAANWGSTPGAQKTVPEIELDDWRLARIGYGQSKLIAEKLLAEAARISNIPASICRVCQVGGPVLRGQRGSWNDREWVPNLIAASQRLRVLPETLGPLNSLDWIPVDLLAQAMIELLVALNHPKQEKRRKLFRKTNTEDVQHFNVFHLSNPRPALWTSLLPTIQRHLGNDIRLIPLSEWVDALLGTANSTDTGDIAGLKLADFFDNLRDKAIRFPDARAAELDTKHTRHLSPTLDSLPAVHPEWMDLWMRQWKASGLLS